MKRSDGLHGWLCLHLYPAGKGGKGENDYETLHLASDVTGITNSPSTWFLRTVWRDGVFYGRDPQRKGKDIKSLDIKGLRHLSSSPDVRANCASRLHSCPGKSLIFSLLSSRLLASVGSKTPTGVFCGAFKGWRDALCVTWPLVILPCRHVCICIGFSPCHSTSSGMAFPSLLGKLHLEPSDVTTVSTVHFEILYPFCYIWRDGGYRFCGSPFWGFACFSSGRSVWMCKRDACYVEVLVLAVLLVCGCRVCLLCSVFHLRHSSANALAYIPAT